MIHAYIDLSQAPAYEREALRGLESEILALVKNRLDAAGLKPAVCVSSTADALVEPGRLLKTLICVGVNRLTPMS